MMKQSEAKPKAKGFTLIEAMVAIVVLTISLLGLAQLMVVALQQYQFAKYDTKAVHVAQTKLEELRAYYSYFIDSGILSEELVAGSHGPILYQPKAPSGSVDEQTDFWVSWQIQDLTKGKKSIRVSVQPPHLNPKTNKVVNVDFLLSP